MGGFHGSMDVRQNATDAKTNHLKLSTSPVKRIRLPDKPLLKDSPYSAPRGCAVMSIRCPIPPHAKGAQHVDQRTTTRGRQCGEPASGTRSALDLRTIKQGRTTSRSLRNI